MDVIHVETRTSLHHPNVSTVLLSVSSNRPVILDRDDVELEDFEQWVDLEDGLREALNIAIVELQPRGNDLMSVLILGLDEHGVEVSVGVPNILFHLLTPELITDNIANSLQSYQTLLLDLSVSFSITRSQNFVLQGTYNFRGSDMTFVANKRSIVQINPPSDEINVDKCLYQWIAIGIAFLIECKGFTCTKLSGFPSKPYSRMTKGKDRFKKRNMCAKQVEDVIGPIQQTNERFDWIGETLGVQLVLYSFINGFRVLFPTNVPIQGNVRPLIFGYVSGYTDINEWNHVDFVRSPEALHCDSSSQFRVCKQCFEIYKRKQLCTFEGCLSGDASSCFVCHMCSGTCVSCHSLTCFKEDHDQPLQMSCSTCFIRFNNAECKNSHRCPRLHWKACDICKKTAHPGLDCSQIRCLFCSEPYKQGDSHDCFIRREKLKPVSTKYAVFDFECCLDQSKIHTPYLCTVWLPFDYDLSLQLSQKYPYQITSSNELVFVFWGLGDPLEETGVFQFFTFLCDKLVKGYTFFAHNARSYDSILIKSFMCKYKRMFSDDIRRGQKLLSMSFPSLDIHFRDSLCFIPSSLRSMSADFGIDELTKGYFPHSLITKDYLQHVSISDFIAPFPDRSYYYHDFHFSSKGKREESELNEWLDEVYSKSPSSWNVRNEAIAYCISDTVLLGRVLVTFQSQLAQMTKEIPRPEGVEPSDFDALAYVTLPSAMMSFFLAEMLPERTIAVIDRFPSLLKQQSVLWILWQEHLLGKNIDVFVVRNGIELTGYCSSMDKAFLFLDCYTYGCTVCYQRNSTNLRYGVSFSDRNQSGQALIQSVKTLFKDFRFCWGHEFIAVQSRDAFRSWKSDSYADIHSKLPLDPRDAYKGGKVEVYKLFYKESISMVDFVSQYPTTLLGCSQDPLNDEDMLQWPMPTGIPTQLWRPKNYSFTSSDKLGIAKVTVWCPPDLLIPFLGYHTPSKLCSQAMEVLYGSCRECMITRSSFPCNHSDKERSFSGTWTLSEIRYAISIGYKVIEINEVWEYPSYDNNLFRSFIVPFMVEKICSKRDKLVTSTNEFTDYGYQVAHYLQELTGKVFSPNDFTNAPSRRTIAKLAQNSFTGKWGESEVRRTTKTFTSSEHAEAYALLTNSNVRILYATLLDIDGEFLSVEYEPLHGSSRTARRKNDLIVSHITAYGRLMLHRVEHVLHEKLIYVDTDSAFHVKDDTAYNTGFRTGDLERELPLASQWVACGRKFYSYVLPNNSIVAKQKGVTLKQSTGSLFVPDQLLRLIKTTWKRLHSLDERSIKKQRKEEETNSDLTITVAQNLFKTVVKEQVIPFKQSVTVQKRTVFRIEALKRRIIWPNLDEDFNEISTVPFGYIE